MPVVHSINLKRRYYAPAGSGAQIFVVLYWISLIIFAFLIAFFTNNLWVKESSYREQPDVAFAKRFALTLQGVGADGITPFEISYSTVPSMNLLAGETVRVPTVTSSFTDSNLDLLADALRVDVAFPLADGERVLSVQGVYVLSYKLRNHVRLETETPLPLSFASGVPGRGLHVDGRLALKLANPLPILPRVRGDEDEPVLQASRIYTGLEASVPALMRSVSSRNDSVVLDPATHAWEARPTACGGDCSFTVALTVRIPAEKVLYVPPFIEVAKFSWIQFVSTLIFLLLFTRPLLNFVIDNQVVQSIVRDDGVKPKII
mmetsp:Transcript_4148/g.8100  ORF Transcript_4148/g.8100 Transcript_4148/m.8100 type:complete len:318 (-) Transcript_4148:27-980(-)